MIKSQAILFVKLPGGDLDSLALLTCEMEVLVIENCLFRPRPRLVRLGRTRGVVIRRLKANLKTTHKSRSDQGHSGVHFRNAV